MNLKETKEFLECMKEDYVQYSDVFDNAISAIDKQIKKPLEIITGFGNKFFYCPTCHMQLSKNTKPKTLHCVYCGQKLDLKV